MSIEQEIKRKIDESEMEFTQEQKFELINIIDKTMKDYVPVEHLKKDTINIVDIYTGMMPKTKAEEHVRKTANLDFVKKYEEDGYKMLFMPRGAFSEGSKVTYLEKGKLNIIELSLGRMPKPKAEKYLHDSNEHFKKIKEFEEYDVTFHGYYDDQSARFPEE